MKNNNVTLVDCTLRDGGYYNNWDFDSSTVDNYFSSLKELRINTVEIGFRFIPKLNVFNGPFAYTTDNFLKNIYIPKNLNLLVMINAKEFGNSKRAINQNINKFFSNKNLSIIQMVRIAVNFEDFKKAKNLVTNLKEKKYKIGLNLMQSDNKSSNEYYQAAKEISKWNSVDVLYFADSLGVMNAKDVKFIVSSLKKGWKGKLGIHAHNNKGLALSNSIEAIKNNVDWVDVTMLGMGRGAGNACTKQLTKRLYLINTKSKNIKNCYQSFNVLKKKYLWGPNKYYYQAAKNRIHPSYIQELLKNNRYTNNDIQSVINYLKSKKSSSYDPNFLQNTLFSAKINNKWSPDNLIKSKEVLLIGAGDTVDKYKKYIQKYIESKSLFIIFCNINKYIDNNIGQITVACNSLRVLLETKDYRRLNHRIIMPDAISKNFLDKSIKTVDYPVKLSPNTFKPMKYYCKLHKPLVFIYALSIILRSNVKKINLVGFDGKKTSFNENIDVFESLKLFSKNKKNVEIVSLTPTNYPINSSSSLFL